jgi:hypothetical protein
MGSLRNTAGSFRSSIDNESIRVFDLTRVPHRSTQSGRAIGGEASVLWIARGTGCLLQVVLVTAKDRIATPLKKAHRCSQRFRAEISAPSELAANPHPEGG